MDQELFDDYHGDPDKMRPIDAIAIWATNTQKIVEFNRGSEGQ